MERKKRSEDDHVCGEYQCKSCFVYVTDANHHCYLRRLQPKGSSENLIFFDFECTQNSGEHVPNFVVAHTTCSECIARPHTPTSTCGRCGNRCSMCNDLRKPPCAACGQREVVFKGENTKQEFGEWLFHKNHKGFTAIAHNMKGQTCLF